MRSIIRWTPAVLALLLLALPATAQIQNQTFTSNAIQRDGSAVALKTATCSVVPEKELFITHLSVVEDCYRTTWSGPCLVPYPQPLPATRGAWTFGALMAGVAGTNDPLALNKFTRDWLAHWQNDLTINGDGVPKRLAIQNHVITPWQNASGGSKVLDMKKAPFRLLAIVARLDLRDASGGYGAANTAGEGRFIFGLTDPTNDQVAKELTVIFEYRLDARQCDEIQHWAHQWHALGSHAFGHQYNAALQAVTDRFTTIGAAPGSPNGSAISQVRTNEIILASPWELREFRLSGHELVPSTPAPLVQTTVARTPNNVHQKQQILANFINGNEAAILANVHDVPLSFQHTPFRGGHSTHSLAHGWDGPGAACASINNNEARHIFSRETCNGCHGDAETGTIFYQVFPRAAGQVAQLAPFLTGASGGGSFFKTDICGLTHGFDDIERRRKDLCNLLASSCAEIAEEQPLLIAH